MSDKIKQAAYANILSSVRRIPPGRVATYSQIARIAGYPRAARLVGRVLQLSDDENIPWHRVINARGSLSFPETSPSYRLQRARLEAEGISFQGQRIELKRYQWQAPDLDILLWKLR